MTRLPLGRSGLPRLVGPTPSRAALDADIDEELRDLELVSRDLETHTLSENTRKAYAKAWVSFAGFCRQRDLGPLPAHPEVVRWYVAWMSTQVDDQGLPRFAIATIRQHLAGIADRHLAAGLLDPTAHRGVSDLVRGLAKVRAHRPERKRPLLLEDVVGLIAAMEHGVYPAGVSASRDAVALWLGFAGALRRSEVAALRVGSVRGHREDGVHVRVGRSKADQENERPDVVVLPFGSTPRTCAPCALHRWVELLVDATIVDDRERRRATMASLLDYQLDTHVCTGLRGSEVGPPAVLDPGSSLLRATYRNRYSATIHEAGISGDGLNAMLHSRMRAAGLDSTPYGFHSLRAGHVTQARRNGATTDEIMRAGRWQRAETVDVYDREYNPALRNSVNHLGL